MIMAIHGLKFLALIEFGNFLPAEKIKFGWVIDVALKAHVFLTPPTKGKHGQRYPTQWLL